MPRKDISPSTGSAQDRRASRAGSRSRLTAALVEDDQMVGEITQRLLQKLFGTVHHLRSAESLLARIDDLAPDLVITDIQLAGMDGRDLIRTLRQRGFSGPIFVLSGTPACDREMAAIGADAALTKPLKIGELKTLLENARRTGGP